MKTNTTINWYSKIVHDLGAIPDFIDYYYNELANARRDSNIGGIIEKNLKELPAQIKNIL